LLNKAANIGLKVFQVGNALNNVFNTPNAGGRYYYTPGGQKFYAPSDEVELFDGKEQKLGDKSIFPMKGTLKAFTIRGDDVEDGAVRFVAKFNPKTGEFKEYVWDKHLNSTYQDFENAFVKDLIEQIDHEDDPLYQHYNSKEEARKSLINLFLFGLLPNPILKTTTGVINATKGGGSWVYGAFKTEAKWAGQLSKRGWTAEQITEAVTKGKSFDAVNKVNKANSATRYVHPTTGQSVVIDNVTKELLHVGGPGFKY